jgi:hypothetical protein
MLDARWEHYRCTSIFEGLIAWLRKKGVTTNTPLHTLRKEFGSRIAAEHGIYAASRLLRHADIRTTASHYLDKKKRGTAGMGHLLSGKVVELGAAASQLGAAVNVTGVSRQPAPESATEAGTA